MLIGAVACILVGTPELVPLHTVRHRCFSSRWGHHSVSIQTTMLFPGGTCSSSPCGAGEYSLPPGSFPRRQVAEVLADLLLKSPQCPSPVYFVLPVFHVGYSHWISTLFARGRVRCWLPSPDLLVCCYDTAGVSASHVVSEQLNISKGSQTLFKKKKKKRHTNVGDHSYLVLFGKKKMQSSAFEHFILSSSVCFRLFAKASIMLFCCETSLKQVRTRGPSTGQRPWLLCRSMT